MWAGTRSEPVTHSTGAGPAHTGPTPPSATEHDESDPLVEADHGETALPAMREAGAASGREYDSDSVGAPSAFSVALSVCYCLPLPPCQGPQLRAITLGRLMCAMMIRIHHWVMSRDREYARQSIILTA